MQFGIPNSEFLIFNRARGGAVVLPIDHPDNHQMGSFGGGELKALLAPVEQAVRRAPGDSRSRRRATTPP